jgi:anti-sigma B factor antagonist
MKIESGTIGDIAIFRLSGMLVGGPEAESLQRRVDALVREGTRKVILDLEQVSYANSTGLGVLIASFRLLKDAGGSLKFIRIPRRVEGLLAVTKLNQLFECYRDEESAVGSFH